jgi:hypothetical protein
MYLPTRLQEQKSHNTMLSFISSAVASCEEYLMLLMEIEMLHACADLNQLPGPLQAQVHQVTLQMLGVASLLLLWLVST